MLVLLLIYCLFIVTHFFLLCFALEGNPTLGSHTGVLLGSLQPFIHMHLLAATNIAAEANVGGTIEMNHLSIVVTGNLQCYTS